MRWALRTDRTYRTDGTYRVDHIGPISYKSYFVAGPTAVTHRPPPYAGTLTPPQTRNKKVAHPQIPLTLKSN